MATKHSKGALPTEKTTLSAREHLDFLKMFESSAMPKGTRAYLVSVNDDGRRELRPVEEDCSIVNLSDADNLIDHLRNAPRSAETLTKLHAYCAERLAQNSKPPTETTEKSAYVRELVSEIAHNIYAMRTMAHAAVGLPEELPEAANCLAMMAERAGLMADSVLEVITGNQVECAVGTDGLDWVLSPRAQKFRAAYEASIAGGN